MSMTPMGPLILEREREMRLLNEKRKRDMMINFMRAYGGSNDPE